MTINAAIIGAISASRAVAHYADYASVVMADSPLAFWRMNEESGSTLADSSGNNRNLTTVSGVTLNNASLTNESSMKCISMDGSNKLSINGGTWMPSGNAARTIELWFSSTAAPSASALGLIGYGASSTRQAFNMRTAKTSSDPAPADKSYVFWTYADDLDATVANSWNTGASHHLALTYDGARNLKAYLDSVLIASKTLSGDLATPTNTTLYIGGNILENAWNGKLQEVAIYDTALSASKIADRYSFHQ